jgi:hypothetical protein
MSKTRLRWDAEAERRLKKAPFFVRKLARGKIEKAARERGLKRITADFVEQVKKKEMG